MQEVVIEFKGALRRVNREQLQKLVDKGFVDLDSRMKIDGRECKLRHVIDQIKSNAETLVPDFSKELSSPFDETPIEKSAIQSRLFNDNPFGSTSDKDFVATKPSGPVAPAVEPPKSNRFLIIMLCAVAGVLLLSVIILSIALTVGGDKKEKDKEREAAASAPVETGPTRFLAGREEPFDRSVDLIDPEYRGTDIADLFDGLEKFWKFEKDEFETTEEFEKRVKDALESASDRPVLGSIAFASTIATPLENYEQEYDADQKILTFKFQILTNQKAKYRSSGTPTLEVFRQEKEYKKKVNVNRVRSRQVEGVERTAFSVGMLKPFLPEVSVEMPADEARALKDNTKALLVFNLDYVPINDNFTSIESGAYDGPGLDRYAVTENFMLVKNLEFWVYNKTTGEVVLKRSLTKDSESK